MENRVFIVLDSYTSEICMKFYKVLESLNNDFESELYHSVSIESTLIKIVIVVFMQMSMER